MAANMPSVPLKEINLRIESLRRYLAKEWPQVSGSFVFSPVNIYYFTGHLGNGVLWIPIHGEPVLLCRKGIERAQMESPLKHVLEFRSYRDICGILDNLGQRLEGVIGIEKSFLPWNLAENFQKHVKNQLTAIDLAIAKTRAVKSSWEIEKLKIAGARHHKSLACDLKEEIRPGMTEWEIAVKVWEVLFKNGHQGKMRMQGFGQEIFLGHISAGDSGNYPSVFNGPLGLKGVHPASPVMGSLDKAWQENEVLSIDCGFVFEGYHTDKTQVYFSKKWTLPEIVKKAQDFCLSLQNWLAQHLVPGAIPSELYAQAVNMAKKQGWESGFMGIGKNKVPFIGHGVGLLIDEYPVLAKGFNEPLIENMVIALEPKIGLPGYGMVGVENTFLITPQGGKSLTGMEFEPIFI